MQYILSKYNIIVRESDTALVVYNCRYGSLVKLDRLTFEQLSTGKLNETKLKELRANGFVTDKNVDEYVQLTDLFLKHCEVDNPTTVSLVIAPTMNCNMQCVYCFESNLTQEIRNNRMTQQTINSIVGYLSDIAKTNSNLEKIVITWFGGEPLLCFDTIVYFSEELKKALNGSQIQLKEKIITNGALLDKNKMKCLSEDCNLDTIQITLDGLCDTYCKKKQTTPEIYKQVITNTALVTKCAKVIVRLNADKANFDELKQLAIELLHQDVNVNNLVFHFAQLRDYGASDNSVPNCFTDFEYRVARANFFDELYAKGYTKKTLTDAPICYSKKPFCGIFPKYNFAIDPDGYLYKCEHQLCEQTKSVGHISNICVKEINVSSFVKDSRCVNCNVFPVCQYAQCEAMHILTGKNKCSKYDDVYNVVVQSVEKYLKKKGEQI